MQLPPPQLMGDSPSGELRSNRQSSISGKVTIHPSAAIASGVLLQADPGAEIVIGPGVCIGAGAILHAHQGKLELESGVNLGFEALLVGSGTVGSNACIGAKATLINPQVGAGEVIGSGTLVGDNSRRVSEPEPSQTSAVKNEPANGQQMQAAQEDSTSPPANLAVPEPTPEGAIAPASLYNQPIYGKAAVERLLSTMFPYRQTLNQPHGSNGSEPPTTGGST